MTIVSQCNLFSFYSHFAGLDQFVAILRARRRLANVEQEKIQKECSPLFPLQRHHAALQEAGIEALLPQDSHHAAIALRHHRVHRLRIIRQYAFSHSVQLLENYFRFSVLLCVLFVWPLLLFSLVF
jgi:hypothetical protein